MAIGGCTVDELKQRMSVPEFIRWMQYYKCNPFDDLHRYHRPAALVSVAMGGGDFVERVELLRGSIEDDASSECMTVAEEEAMWLGLLENKE